MYSFVVLKNYITTSIRKGSVWIALSQKKHTHTHTHKKKKKIQVFIAYSQCRLFDRLPIEILLHFAQYASDDSQEKRKGINVFKRQNDSDTASDISDLGLDLETGPNDREASRVLAYLPHISDECIQSRITNSPMTSEEKSLVRRLYARQVQNSIQEDEDYGDPRHRNWYRVRFRRYYYLKTRYTSYPMRNSNN